MILIYIYDRNASPQSFKAEMSLCVNDCVSICGCRAEQNGSPRPQPPVFHLAQVTDGFVTADEEEESAAKAASDMLGSVADAAKDMKKKAKSSLKDLKSGLGEAVNRGDGDVDAEEAGEGVDLSARLPKGGDGGKVDVSYV